MRLRPRAILILCSSLSLLVLPMAFAQPPPSNTQQSPSDPQPADYEQFLPYWTTATNWHCELQLRNNLIGGPLTVTPALRTADGTETSFAPVIIQPQEVKSIDY